MNRLISVAMTLLILVTVQVKQAKADSILTSALVYASIIAASNAAPPLTWAGAAAEAAAIAAEAARETDQQKRANLPAVGALFVNNSIPYYYSTDPSINLTYAWIDPFTNSITSGIAVSSVAYYLWNGGQITLDGTSIGVQSGWNYIGSSSNGLNNFLINTIVPRGSEALFLANPLDSNGNVITISGVDGLNDGQGLGVDLQPTPEPATILLMGIGLAGTVLMRFRAKGSEG